MKEKELVQEFLSRVSGIVSHMKTYGENVSNETIVSKVLRSLTKDFDHVVPAIEESKDLSNYSFDALMSSLLAHEADVNWSYEKVEEKTFQVKGETSVDPGSGCASSSCGRGGFRGRGRGRGQGRGCGKGGSNDEMQNKVSFHFTVITADCWQRHK